MSDPETIGRLLDGLTGHGIYSVAMVIEQFPKFGFIYDQRTDRLTYGFISVRLGSGTRAQIERSIAQDPQGGILDQDTGDERLVDAIALSEAVFRLLIPGIPPRSELYVNRNKGFRANVAAILERERTSTTN